MLELVHKELWDWTNCTTHPCLDKSECLGSGVSNDDDGVTGVVWDALLTDTEHVVGANCQFMQEEKKKNSKRTSAPVSRNSLRLAVCHDVQQKKSARTDPDETPLGLISVTGLRQLKKER